MPVAVQAIGVAAIVAAFVVIWSCTAANHPVVERQNSE
jgi:hypothetical protein